MIIVRCFSVSNKAVAEGITIKTNTNIAPKDSKETTLVNEINIKRE